MNTENSAQAGGSQFQHLEITRRVVGVFFEVYGELGYGFLESIYREAMTMALREAGLLVQPELKLEARFRGQRVALSRPTLPGCSTRTGFG